MLHNKILRASIITAIFIAVIATALLLLFMPKENTHTPHTPLGTITRSETEVFVNHEKIPTYSYDERIFIVAEDLQNFGAVIIKSDEGNITLTYDKISEKANRENSFARFEDGAEIYEAEFMFYINGSEIEHYTAADYNIIPAEALENLPHTSFESSDNSFHIAMSTDIENPNVIAEATPTPENGEPAVPPTSSDAPASKTTPQTSARPIIVLDPGHGRSSSAMNAEERENEGWVYSSAKGQWGEWRHWKNNSRTTDCEGEGCNHYGDCWYPMANGDRSTEPEINLANCLAAKKYLEDMGYTVRLTRSTANENPSITKRISYCYPNGDTEANPDASVFICVHSNAGGGRGSAYIELVGDYAQKGISSTYIEDGNRLGKTINDEIVSETSLPSHAGGKIGNEGYLIAFNKSPVICGYLEIGFFDNSADLSILKNETDKIGKAIANGIDKFMKSE